MAAPWGLPEEVLEHLEASVEPLEVSSRRFSEPRGCLGGDIAFGVGFLMLWQVSRRQIFGNLKGEAPAADPLQPHFSFTLASGVCCPACADSRLF